MIGIKHSPGMVYANHLEALNHCPNRREDLRALLRANNLLDKVAIPEDGEMVVF